MNWILLKPDDLEILRGPSYRIIALSELLEVTELTKTIKQKGTHKY